MPFLADAIVLNDSTDIPSITPYNGDPGIDSVVKPPSSLILRTDASGLWHKYLAADNKWRRIDDLWNGVIDVNVSGSTTTTVDTVAVPFFKPEQKTFSISILGWVELVTTVAGMGVTIELFYDNGSGVPVAQNILEASIPVIGTQKIPYTFSRVYYYGDDPVGPANLFSWFVRITKIGGAGGDLINYQVSTRVTGLFGEWKAF